MTPEQIVDGLVRTRRLMGMSQRDVANRIGVWQSTVSDWESGAQPALASVVRWAEVLGYRLTLVPANQLQEVAT